MNHMVVVIARKPAERAQRGAALEPELDFARLAVA